MAGRHPQLITSGYVSSEGENVQRESGAMFSVQINTLEQSQHFGGNFLVTCYRCFFLINTVIILKTALFNAAHGLNYIRKCYFSHIIYINYCVFNMLKIRSCFLYEREFQLHFHNEAGRLIKRKKPPSWTADTHINTLHSRDTPLH